MKKSEYSFCQQAVIFAIIILISKFVANLLPIPVPSSVVGMILLFIALCTGVVKLEQVEGLSNSLSKVITFLFVPSGISLVNSLDLMASYGLQIVFVIFVATLALLFVTGWSGALLLKLRQAKKFQLSDLIPFKQTQANKGDVRL